MGPCRPGINSVALLDSHPYKDRPPNESRNPIFWRRHTFMPTPTHRGESGSRRGGCPYHHAAQARNAVPIVGTPPKTFGSTKTARRSGGTSAFWCARLGHELSDGGGTMWDGRRLTPTRTLECRRISITPPWPRAQGPVPSKGPRCVTHEGGEAAVEGFGEANAPISWKQAPNQCVSGSPKSVLLHLPWASVCRGVLPPVFESPATAEGGFLVRRIASRGSAMEESVRFVMYQRYLLWRACRSTVSVLATVRRLGLGSGVRLVARSAVRSALCLPDVTICHGF